MLKIRLQRIGRKNDPSFRVVVTEHTRGPKAGNNVELVGSYDARRDDNTRLDADRIKYWISKGAQPSDTVHNLLIKEKIIEGTKVNVLPRKSPVIKEAEETEDLPAGEAGKAAPEVAAEAPSEGEEVKEESASPDAEPEEPATEDLPAGQVGAPKEEVKEEAPAEEKEVEAKEEVAPEEKAPEKPAA